MVTFLFITAAIVLIIVGIAFYFRRKTSGDNSNKPLLHDPQGRGLFSEIAESKNNKQKQPGPEMTTEALIKRAQDGDRTALIDTHKIGNANIYDVVLTELVRDADSDAKLLALMSFVSANQLPVNLELGQAVMAAWQKSPNRNGTAKALHFAALTDNAEIYRTAVESALTLWRGGKLPDISGTELRALFDGEFWILSSHTRSSGAGFVLKQTLADARRELEAATRVTQ
jgi:hypothetical protein